MTEKFINIIHVGGRGSGIGPIADFVKNFKSDIELVIFEADNSLKNAGLKELPDNSKIISKCLSNYTGKSKFNINSDERSSSLFKVSKEAIDYITPVKWGDSCKTMRTIDVDVTTIDRLIIDNEIKSPHFISLDAQGSEYNILEASTCALNDNLIGVLTEVEFREIYENQKLFSDIDLLLKKYDFQLFHFFNWQFWSYDTRFKERIDEFPLTAEVLYLRNFNYFLEKNYDISIKLENLARLIMFASHFKKASYATKILEYINSNFEKEWVEFLKKRNNISLK